MTTIEAERLIDSVLRHLWSRWEPKDHELRVWSKRLRRYDYGRAKSALNELFFELPMRVSPPAKEIVQCLKRKAFIRPPESAGEPVYLYSIIGQTRFDRGFTDFEDGEIFCVGNESMKPERQEIERRAERDRNYRQRFYQENQIIIYPTKTYY